MSSSNENTGIATNVESSSLINNVSDLNLDIRSINYYMTNLFRRCSIAANKIQNGGLIGKSQTKQIHNGDGVPISYDKGKIVVKNGIDQLMFLLNHRSEVADMIGVSSSDIWNKRRNYGAMSEFIHKMNSLFVVGDKDKNMQMFISKTENNTSGLEYLQDWTDYILTQDWIDSLVKFNLGEHDLEDMRIENISQTIDNAIEEHEIDFHSDLSEFDTSQFLDNGGYDIYADAVNRLNSFNELDYCVYEVFKPIGKSSQKYIKTRVFTNGWMDVSGVLGLKDCEHWEWEYGSPAYLRSLNTGNQRYIFRLDVPINDENSTLYWKPDHPEEMVGFNPDADKDPELVEQDQQDSDQQKKWHRYYKPYEKERFLRWFGLDRLPAFDEGKMFKTTICSIPILKNDAASEDFHRDATNITSSDLQRIDMDDSTSQSLLTLTHKGTVKVGSIEGREGQYIQFLVNGHQQTANLAFHLQGRISNSSTSEVVSRFYNTWSMFSDLYHLLGMEIIFLETSSMINSDMQEVWNSIHPGEKWIPDDWFMILERLEKLDSPSAADLVRMRCLDMETILYAVSLQDYDREEFVQRMGSKRIVDENGMEADQSVKPDNVTTFYEWKWYLNKTFPDSKENQDKWMGTFKSKQWFNQALYEYIHQYDSASSDDLDIWFNQIPLSDEIKTSLVKENLSRILSGSSKFDSVFDSIGVDELGDSISTYNNLVVRLPVGTEKNKKISRHIFLDWKTYVDSVLSKLLQQNMLFTKKDESGNVVYETEMGTDGKPHKYIEYYRDEELTVPLVDYSYMYDEDGERKVDEDGNLMYDRWDFWSEEDFI